MSGEIAVCHKTPALRQRARIFDLQSAILEGVENGTLTSTGEPPLEHRFIPGGYSRSMRLKANDLIVGKIHRYACFNFITEGSAVVITENGRTEVSAGDIFTSGPGTKRVIFAKTDLAWTTVHVTKETDLTAIEADLICESYSDFDAEKAQEMLK